jgi:hypothetical protein
MGDERDRNEVTASDPEKSLLDQWVDRLKNKIWIAALALAAMALAWITNVGGDIGKLYKFLFPPETESTQYATATTQTPDSENIGHWKHCRPGPPTFTGPNYHCLLRQNGDGSYQLTAQVYDTKTSATCTAICTR